MALERVPFPSPNYSSRGGSSVRLIVLHTAEGARTIESLGSFFSNPSSGVSSHVGVDDKPNTVGVYVQRPDKAWTQGNANPVAVSAELCGFASWTRAEWEGAHSEMLANTAKWVAEEAAAFGIPLRELTSAEAQGGVAAGVCQHIDLGSWGGGHVDCDYGTGNFPMDHILEMAAGGAPSPSPTPPHPETLEDLVITCMLDRDGYTVVFGIDESGDLWEVTTKPADPATPMTRYYRWSNLTANGGHKLATA